MKNLIKACIILSAFFSVYSLSGQENKYSILIGGVIDHYGNLEKEKFTPVPGYNKWPLSRGIEILFSRKLNEDFTILSGINYQKGKTSSFVNEVQRRFKFSEINLPLLLRKFIPANNGNYYFTGGVYLGKITSAKSELYSSLRWFEIKDISTVEYYSDNEALADLYFDMAYQMPIYNKFDFSISPFLKYRINSTWLNNYQTKHHYGIKISIILKL